MDASLVMVFLGTLGTLGLIGFALGGAFAGPAARLRRRALTLQRRARADEARRRPQAAPGSLKKVEGRSLWPAVERLIRRFLPRQSVLRLRLARTGRNITVGNYALFSAGLVLIALAACLLFGLAPMISVLVALMVGLGLPHICVGHMARRRMSKFAAAFPDAVDLIVRGLKSGLPVNESMAAVGREMPDPVGYEFRLIADNVRFGQTLEQALWETAKRLDTPEFKFFVVSISIQRETGGNLAETLTNLSDILRRRRQMRLKVKAMSSEARASAIILGSLPFLMFGIIYMVNGDYESMLFTDPRGRLVLGLGLVTMSLGIVVMHKMVRFEV